MRVGATWLGASVAIALAFAAPAQAGGPFVVNDVGDDGDMALGGICDTSASAGNQCTLRAAIQEANFTAGSDLIEFDIPGQGVATIAPQSLYPVITQPVTIDGYSQPGASANTAKYGKPLNTKIKIFLDGDAVPPGFPIAGLNFDSGAATSAVQGLAIGNFDGGGVFAGVPVTVTGNFLGTNAAGTNAMPNAEGFFGYTGAGSLIGGDDPADTNLISGNDYGGVVSNPAVVVQGNYIGTKKDGKSPLGNGVGLDRGGVLLYDASVSNAVFKNVIAHNGAAGITLYNFGPGSIFTDNRMFGNETIGIDLNGDGVTDNDPSPDADLGPNGLQNYPVIAGATRMGSKTQVVVRLSSEPESTYTVDVYEADGKTRQGKRLLGSKTLTTDEEGHAGEAIKVKKLKAGKRVVVTATNPNLGTNGATSEFSKPKKVK